MVRFLRCARSSRKRAQDKRTVFLLNCFSLLTCLVRYTRRDAKLYGPKKYAMSLSLKFPLIKVASANTRTGNCAS